MKLYKDTLILNCIKRLWFNHSLKIVATLTLLALWLCYLTLSFYQKKEYKPQPGDVVTLWSDGSITYVKPEDADENDIKIGIVSSVNDSGYTTTFGHVRDIKIK